MTSGPLFFSISNTVSHARRGRTKLVSWIVPLLSQHMPSMLVPEHFIVPLPVVAWRAQAMTQSLATRHPSLPWSHNPERQRADDNLKQARHINLAGVSSLVVCPASHFNTSASFQPHCPQRRLLASPPQPHLFGAVTKPTHSHHGALCSYYPRHYGSLCHH